MIYSRCERPNPSALDTLYRFMQIHSRHCPLGQHLLLGPMRSPYRFEDRLHLAQTINDDVEMLDVCLCAFEVCSLDPGLGSPCCD